MNMMQLQDLIETEPDSIFARGLTKDNAAGINLTNSGKTLRWVAVRGGIHDWAIYAHTDAHGEHEPHQPARRALLPGGNVQPTVDRDRARGFDAGGCLGIHASG